VRVPVARIGCNELRKVVRIGEMLSSVLFQISSSELSIPRV